MSHAYSENDQAEEEEEEEEGDYCSWLVMVRPVRSRCLAAAAAA